MKGRGLFGRSKQEGALDEQKGFNPEGDALKFPHQSLEMAPPTGSPGHQDSFVEPANQSQKRTILRDRTFNGHGQGLIKLKVWARGDDLGIELVRNHDLDDTCWDFPVRNSAEMDMDIAEENVRTLLWRASQWYLTAWIDWINNLLINRIIERDGASGWLQYSVHMVKEDPFEDTEAHSPVAVIDSHFCPLLERRGTTPIEGEWQHVPWAAVFLHDATLLSCLPEDEDRYFEMLDLLPRLVGVAARQRCFADQVDFLGCMHKKVLWGAKDMRFPFLKDWGVPF